MAGHKNYCKILVPPPPPKRYTQTTSYWFSFSFGTTIWNWLRSDLCLEDTPSSKYYIWHTSASNMTHLSMKIILVLHNYAVSACTIVILKMLHISVILYYKGSSFSPWQYSTKAIFKILSFIHYKYTSYFGNESP